MEERRVKENLAGQRRGRSLPLLLSLSLSLSVCGTEGQEVVGLPHGIIQHLADSIALHISIGHEHAIVG